ncbi:uncharacterized protein [Eurosta solidaginis]|uniref:uncharacterized protein n=1 Tax=Eurosta solidaginis TaxID=178769 RepID=UPI0035315BEC
MSSMVSDSGTLADLDIGSRKVAVVSATSVAAAAPASVFVVCSNETTTNGAYMHLGLSEKSPLCSSEIPDEKDNSDIDEISVNGTGSSLHLSLMQTSPPPHSYRHSRAYRHFKNPPQPHMCIRTTSESGEELFINVLSWTRIVIPQEPTDPIPLYGGMRVPPGSPRSPPIVFAVMANPEVLKDSGRHSRDPEERRAMVELMCDFVEAMNPGVKLIRNAVILKDRDISGELKDVWNAVQAQRDREREEQMMQQRQQHFHNVTTQQMFPKLTEGARVLDQRSKKTSPEKADKIFLDSVTERPKSVTNDTSPSDGGIISMPMLMGLCDDGKTNVNNHKEANNIHSSSINNENTCGDDSSIGTPLCGKDQIDATNKLPSIYAAVCNADTSAKTSSNSQITTVDNIKINKEVEPNINTLSSFHNVVASPSITSSTLTPFNPTTITTQAANTAPVPTSTKKDKLVGFLPNGCIFPRFKNNKNKEKDKEKEGKAKDKERTLLYALKKSKDKKVVPIENSEKVGTEAEAKISYERNCINLESEVQKLDLNKAEAPTSGENVFIKLKMATSSAAAK